MNIQRVKEIYAAAEQHMKNDNIGYFEGFDKPLFRISNVYPGVWLEHLYDSVFYAKLYPGENEYMRNIIELYISNQREDGQLPFTIMDRKFLPGKTEEVVRYTHIQECVSFASVCLEAYNILKDKEFLRACYDAAAKWVHWIEKHRMTQNKGLIEMFCGFDTGHDNSGRVTDIGCPDAVVIDGVWQNADVLPPEDGITPVIAVDMNCNFYGNLISLSKMALLLGDVLACEKWIERAEAVKKRIFEVCFDENDCFFYDVDKNGNFRKIKSSTIFHLFLERVLDKDKDCELIREIYTRHIKNPNEFWTNYPFPSVAYDDPSAKNHCKENCWGYFCQMNIYIRCTLWMDYYGFGEDFDHLLKQDVRAWTEHFDSVKLGQELDPMTGVPTNSSEWYSACMLTYVYAVRRLGLLDRE